MRANSFATFLIAASAFLLGACSDAPNATETSSDIPLDPAEFRAQVREQSGIDLIPLSLDDWDFEMRSLGGQVVVFDYWATWCVPCIERFPHMVEMAEHYKDKPVRFISVNLDDPHDPEAFISALDFLLSINARFEHYHLTADMFDSFRALGLQSIPAVSIFGIDGREAVRLSGDDPNNQFTETDIETEIERLLEEMSQSLDA